MHNLNIISRLSHLVIFFKNRSDPSIFVHASTIPTTTSERRQEAGPTTP